MYTEFGTKRHTSTTHPGQLEKIASNLTAAGCTLPPVVLEALEEASARNKHIDDVEADLHDTSGAESKAARNLANGEGTADDVRSVLLIKQLTTVDLEKVYQDDQLIFNKSRGIIRSRLLKAFRAPGDDWITEVMRPVVTPLVEKLRNADVPTFPVDLKANLHALEPIAAQGDVAEAWDQLTGIYTAAEKLRLLNAIPSTLHRQDLYEFADMPEVREARTHTYTTWTLYARRGHQPGIYTETEVQEMMERNGIALKTASELTQQRYAEAAASARRF